MNKKFILFAACVMGLAACKSGGTEVTTDKESALQQAVTPYVENTVIATYGAMADAGLTLLDQCKQILAKVEAGEDYSKLMSDLRYVVARDAQALGAERGVSVRTRFGA